MNLNFQIKNCYSVLSFKSKPRSWRLMIKELCTTRFYFLKKIILYLLSSFIWVASILSEKSMFIDQRYGYCNRESSTYFLPVVFLMVMAMLLSEYRSCITIWPTAANNYANVGISTRHVVYSKVLNYTF